MIQITLRKLLSDKVLANEIQTLTFKIPLALIVGKDDAIFLSRLNFWLNTKYGKVRDGKTWIYNSVDQWLLDLPFWSPRTFKTMIARLKKAGIIETTSKYNKLRTDRTSWYTINYNAKLGMKKADLERVKARSKTIGGLLEKLGEPVENLGEPVGKTSKSKGSNLHDGKGKNDPVLPEGTNVPSLPEKDKRTSSSSLREEIAGDPPSAPARSSFSPSRTSEGHTPQRGPHLPPDPGDTPPPSIRERHLANGASKLRARPTQAKVIQFWKFLTAEWGVDSAIHTGKERGLVKSLIGWWEEKQPDLGLDEYLAHAVENWGQLRADITWENGKPRLSAKPSFQEIYFVKELVLHHMGQVAEKQAAAEAKKASLTKYTRVEDIPEDHPNRAALVTMVELNGQAEG